jgi:hypothetical protein
MPEIREMRKITKENCRGVATQVRRNSKVSWNPSKGSLSRKGE